MKVSVAMATYNGEKFIKEQIASILPQLSNDDELIVSDDGSSDHTLDILSTIQDKRISINAGPRKGIFKNFENSIRLCTGDIIFLSDQDDIWIDKKIQVVKDTFINHPDVKLILHSKYDFYNDGKKDTVVAGGYHAGMVRNIIGSCYWGCCMAFKRDFILPYLHFPNWGIAHDQLIGLLGESEKNVLYIDIPLIIHRYHEHNATHRGTLYEKIDFRIRLLFEFLICKIRKSHFK